LERITRRKEKKRKEKKKKKKKKRDPDLFSNEERIKRLPSFLLKWN